MCFMFTLAMCIVAVTGFSVVTPQPGGQGTGRGIPIAKRGNWLSDDNSVNFDALRSHVASVQAKVLRGFDNFERNTGEQHPSAAKGEKAAKRGEGDPLVDYYEFYWYGDMSVGTPRGTLTVEFDTGSSDTFVPRNDCTSCGGHYGWVPSASSTSRDLGKTFNLTYADGSNAISEQYVDTVSVADITATIQTIGAATSYSAHLQESVFPSDGLMGMGFLPISEFHAPPFFDTLVREGKVTDPAFSVKLADTGSELYIGGSNAALYLGSFTYVEVTHVGWWQVNMDNILGNGHAIFNNVDVIIDTGTTVIAASPEPVAQLYAALGGTINNGYYSFPCNNFPTISLTFAGTTFPLSSSTLNFGQVSIGSPYCACGILALDSPFVTNFWIVGEAFLRNVYTRFDFGNASVGFAHLA